MMQAKHTEFKTKGFTKLTQILSDFHLFKCVIIKGRFGEKKVLKSGEILYLITDVQMSIYRCCPFLMLSFSFQIVNAQIIDK